MVHTEKEERGPGFYTTAHSDGKQQRVRPPLTAEQHLSLQGLNFLSQAPIPDALYWGSELSLEFRWGQP